MHKTLYRTYRPQVFEDVIGQELISSTLKNAIKEKKIAHAYLFSGRSGTGKTTLAKIFAKAINCTSNNKPCNTCETCTLINKEQTIDFIEIDAASNNGIEQIRNLIESIQYPPIVCKYKVYIIDEVHMLSNAAFNALLKTLEEPPTNSVFILATTEEHKIPETILTRCQRFNLQKISNKAISELIVKVLTQENKEFEQNATELIADMASGGARKALSITEQCMHLDKVMTVDSINKAYGLLTTEELINFMQAIYQNDKTLVFKILNVANKNGTDYQRLLEEILVLLKEVLIKEINSDKLSLKFINNLNKDKINFNEIFIFKAIKLIQQSLSQIRFSSNPKLTFEITILQLAKINDEDEITNKSKKLMPKKEITTEHQQSKEAESIVFSELPKVDEQITKKPIVEKPVVEKLESEIIKTENNVTNKLKQELREELSVKKETLIKEIMVENIQNEVEDEFNEVLNILLAATKIQREFFAKKWNEIITMSRNPENSKWISMLTNSKVVAASNEATIILFEYEPSANILNSKKTDQNFLKFIKEIFGREYLFVGTFKKNWEKEKENYKKLRTGNKLPIFREIIVPKIKEKTIEEKTLVQEAVNLFGESLEIEGET